jgi:hypothetical protein
MSKDIPAAATSSQGQDLRIQLPGPCTADSLVMYPVLHCDAMGISLDNTINFAGCDEI